MSAECVNLHVICSIVTFFFLYGCKLGSLILLLIRFFENKKHIFVLLMFFDCLYILVPFFFFLEIFGGKELL